MHIPKNNYFKLLSSTFFSITQWKTNNRCYLTNFYNHYNFYQNDIENIFDFNLKTRG